MNQWYVWCASLLFNLLNSTHEFCACGCESFFTNIYMHIAKHNILHIIFTHARFHHHRTYRIKFTAQYTHIRLFFHVSSFIFTSSNGYSVIVSWCYGCKSLVYRSFRRCRRAQMEKKKKNKTTPELQSRKANRR